MKALSQLRLWQKLALLVAALALPSVLLGVFYLIDSNAQVSLAQNEIDGARYERALGALLAETSNHRSRLFESLTGGDQAHEALMASEALMSQRIAQVDASDVLVGRRLGVTERWQSVRSEWERLRADGSHVGADESVARHNALLLAIRKLADLLATQSGLNADPSAQTSVLIQIATRNIPEAMIASGDVRWFAARASIKGYLGGDDRTAIQLYRQTVIGQFEAANRSLERASDEARARIRPDIVAASGAFATFFGALQKQIITAQKMEITPAEVFSAARPVSTTLQQLSDTSYLVMSAAVQQRLTAVTAWRNLTAGIGAVTLAFALLLSWLITRSLSRPLAHAIGVFNSIAGGQYDSPIRIHGTDEAAQVLGALDVMQGKLRRQVEAERAAAAENRRIRQALDKISASVIVADASQQIIYVNETAQRTFAERESQIRKSLPGFDARRLRGSSLDVMTNDPGQQRRTIDALAGSEAQQRVLGECTFHTVANPVVNAEGKRIGTIVEWTDRTMVAGIEKEMRTMLGAVVAGQLGARIGLDGKSGFFAAMSRGINQLADNMAEVVAKVKTVAAEVHRGADEISTGNANLSQRTEEQSSSLEETASSMEEMTTTVKQNADNAGQANQLAIAARDQAERGGAVVSQAVRAMAEINEASRRIADIIGVIDDIAFQTNLLALNAAVEAARAGEQGRGFAVVASEVRSLAGRSATAAKQIKDLIQDSVRKVEGGSVLVTQSGQTLEKIVAAVKKVSDIVAEIAAASREQSSGIEQVNRAVMQMDELTQQNAALVEQATAASQAMAEQVRGLNQMLGRYQASHDDDNSASPVPAMRHSPFLSATHSAPRPAPARAARANPDKATRHATSFVGAARAAPQATPVTGAVSADSHDSEWQEF